MSETSTPLPPSVLLLTLTHHVCLTPSMIIASLLGIEITNNPLHVAIWFLFLPSLSSPSWSLLSGLTYYWGLCIDNYEVFSTQIVSIPNKIKYFLCLVFRVREGVYVNYYFLYSNLNSGPNGCPNWSFHKMYALEYWSYRNFKVNNKEIKLLDLILKSHLIHGNF